MIHLIGQHWEGDVLVKWWGDDTTNMVVVEHLQDPQAALDKVAAANADGATGVDGMGKALVELPIVPAMKYCRERGIPWEAFLYTNEYAAEYKRFASEHSKLAYQNAKRVHAVQ